MTDTSLVYLGGRLFRPVDDAHHHSGKSQTGIDTIFKYEQRDTLVTAHYAGKIIKFGQLIGLLKTDNQLDFRYHHVTFEGDILTGMGKSSVEILPNNKVRLHEQWQWTSGDRSHGTSLLEEI